MRKTNIFAALMLAGMTSLGASAQHQFAVQANKPGVEIQPTMYGIFFEDINFGADGGLYAEMVENRSFEFPQRLMGWNTFGNVTLNDVKPAFDRNPHYVTLESAGAREKQTGLENRGFFGMGLKKDMKYDFTVYGRLHLIDGKQGKIRVELVNSKNDVIAKQVINITFPHRLFPNYYQSLGLGFYEYFLLSEKIGAEPLPILSVGLACQYQNRDDDKNAHVAVDDLQSYIDDALDLIEFANGPVTSKWGKLRADMGHPAPFNLKQIGIGNEQWGPMYPERLQKFMEQIRAKYPKIKICGSSGPSADGKDFDYGWEQMRKLGTDLVDEHYYKSPEWFRSNAGRYDNYDRKGPKVFAGEYAAHAKHDPNSWEAALSEAAFMTGLERNADVVYQATYAPLFAHVEGWQWRPDLIWFDNLTSVRSANYYVQQLYGLNKGTNVLKLTENGKAVEGKDGLYATACYDKNTKSYIVKIANTSNEEKDITVTFNGLKKLNAGKLTLLHADDIQAENKIDNKNAVVPVTSDVEANGNVLNVKMKANSFAVYRF